ncbi:50S ribosomal protein L15 [Candidatus Parcubacteria bacterium]|nr:MAG: 50S ribosomal protein L15 [Candidatus Parcubacteria bacterium]
MVLNLHNLKSYGKRKAKKRIGRGNGSGHGTYSTRGMKGQRARTGGSKGLKIIGLKNFLRKVPKTGGFHSLKGKMTPVKLQDLEKVFNDGDKVTTKALVKKNLVNDDKERIKILSQGILTKKLDVFADAFSKTAKDAIIKAGGKANIIAKD